LTFERIAIRLGFAEPGAWIVKGGMALEWRLPGMARATKDLDLALRVDDLVGEDVRDRLIEALDSDPDRDVFRFAVGPAEPLGPDDGARGGLGFAVRAELAGRLFEAVQLDVVPRAAEIRETDRVMLSRFLEFAGILPRDVEVVTPRHQFAEKLHAFTRDYGDRENSRVRDLADMVLLVEKRLVTEPRLVPVCATVFDRRGTHPLPNTLPDPPLTWISRYEAIAGQLGLQARTTDEAMARLRRFWKRALAVHGSDEAS
jgi:hypothetical protein